MIENAFRRLDAGHLLGATGLFQLLASLLHWRYTTTPGSMMSAAVQSLQSRWVRGVSYARAPPRLQKRTSPCVCVNVRADQSVGGLAVAGAGSGGERRLSSEGSSYGCVSPPVGSTHNGGPLAACRRSSACRTRMCVCVWRTRCAPMPCTCACWREPPLSARRSFATCSPLLRCRRVSAVPLRLCPCSTDTVVRLSVWSVRTSPSAWTCSIVRSRGRS